VEPAITTIYHELIFSVKLRNESALQEFVHDRSDPDNLNFQSWLHYDGLKQLVSNEEAYTIIIKWLKDNHISVIAHK
jgi:hypothetical protein